MNKVCQKDIERSINKHFGFAVILAVVPVVFIELISLFTDGLDSLLTLIVPIAVIGACADFVKRVLVDLCIKNEQET